MFCLYFLKTQHTGDDSSLALLPRLRVHRESVAGAGGGVSGDVHPALGVVVGGALHFQSERSRHRRHHPGGGRHLPLRHRLVAHGVFSVLLSLLSICCLVSD